MPPVYQTHSPACKSIVACRDLTLSAPPYPSRSPEQSNIVVNGIDVGSPLSRAGAVQLPHAFDGRRVIGLQATSPSHVLQRVEVIEDIKLAGIRDALVSFGEGGLQRLAKLPLDVETPKERDFEEADRPHRLGLEMAVLGDVLRPVLAEENPDIWDGKGLAECGRDLLDELLFSIWVDPLG